ncbi:MAG TPA: hypothetical protein VNQ76_02075 [Planctomicrobium sp.]|nr:hypothetical protein [Planctomicrobium sp.]
MRAFVRCFSGIVLLLTFLIAGCGGKTENFDRVVVSGEITFNGQLVPHGSIWFEPDASIGAASPTGFAIIRNGKFKTERSKAPKAGKYLIRVSGSAQTREELAKDTANDEIEVPPLFPEYTETVEILEGGAPFQITIPGKAEKKL